MKAGFPTVSSVEISRRVSEPMVIKIFAVLTYRQSFSSRARKLGWKVELIGFQIPLPDYSCQRHLRLTTHCVKD
jgi:hypothetical protein